MNMNWKKVPYYIPLIGLIYHAWNERKERKGKKPIYNIKDPKDRKALGKYAFQICYLGIIWPLKIAGGLYVHQGISTGEWNPIKSVKEIVVERREKSLERKERRFERQNGLEKNVHMMKF